FRCGARLDYRSDVKAWIGAALALAFRADGTAMGVTNGSLVVGVVRVEAGARAAIGRIVGKAKGTTTSQDYNGVAVTAARGSAGEAGSCAILQGMLLSASDDALLSAGIDAAPGRSTSLAGADAFRTATQAT